MILIAKQKMLFLSFRFLSNFFICLILGFNLILTIQ